MGNNQSEIHIKELEKEEKLCEQANEQEEEEEYEETKVSNNNMTQIQRSRSKSFDQLDDPEKATKYAVRAHPRARFNLTDASEKFGLHKVINFLHKNRIRVNSLKSLSAKVNIRGLVPMLLNRVPQGGIVQRLGKQLSRFRNLQQVQIGCSDSDCLKIEEVLLDSLSRLKKIKALSLEIPDEPVKINYMSKKLATFKGLTRLNLNFFVQNGQIKNIINAIKSCSRLRVLRLNLTGCNVTSEHMTKISETILKLRCLEYFIIHLDKTQVTTQDVDMLYEKIEKHHRLQYFKIYVFGCPNVSWMMRAQLYAQENFIFKQIAKRV